MLFCLAAALLLQPGLALTSTGRAGLSRSSKRGLRRRTELRWVSGPAMPARTRTFFAGTAGLGKELSSSPKGGRVNEFRPSSFRRSALDFQLPRRPHLAAE